MSELKPPKNCLTCAGEAPALPVFDKFAHVDYGHGSCRKCGISFDSNVNAMLDVQLSAEEVRDITDEETYRKLFVETSTIGDEKGNVYTDFNWADNEALKSGVARHVVDVLIRHGMARPQQLLDLGCGNGFTSLELAKAFPETRIIAVDPSPEVVKVDGKLGVAALQGTLDSLRFGTARFDVVIIIGNLMLHTDPQKTLAEANRVLKPGGILVIDFKNVDSLVRWFTLRLSWLGLAGLVPRGLLERSFINMRFGYRKSAMRKICNGLILKELECYSKPPRLLEFANAAELQSGLKGLIWRLTDKIDSLRDERAWVQMAWRKPV
jgi:ubiquinone/menaquinone biosynthesis C-methylase UbiE